MDTESIKTAAREWGWAYASLFSLQSLVFISLALWHGITDPPAGGFYPAFSSILRDVGIAGLASVVFTTTILEGGQSVMIISATFLKPRERRIREEGYEAGLAEGIEIGRAEVAESSEAADATQAAESAQTAQAAAQVAQIQQTLELERAAWQAWHQRSELARARGEEPPPPPFFGNGNGRSS